MNPALRRTLLWAALATPLAAGLIYAFLPKPVPIDAVVAERKALQETVTAEGRTRIHDVFVLSAPVSGRLRRIDAEAGDQVIAGRTELAWIEPSDPSFLDERTEAEARADIQAADAALALARANVDQVRAELDFAAAELDRARRLIRSGTIPQRTLDDAERRFRTANAALATAKAAVRVRVSELSRAQARLVVPTDAADRRTDCACITIRAPIDGQVLRVLEESAGVVAAGVPLIEIGNPRQLEIVADFLSSDAVRISPGQRALLEEWGGERDLNALVRRVEPYGFTKISALGIEEQRVNVILDLTDPPESWGRLGHGYRVDVRIVLWEGGSILQLPLTALFRNGENWATYIVGGNGRARLRLLGLGRRNHLAAEILTGLKEGETAVLHPSNRIRDGGRVERRPAD